MRIYSNSGPKPGINLLPWAKSRLQPHEVSHNTCPQEITHLIPKYFFKTKRLIFRPLRASDFPQMYSIVSKPSVSRYVDDGLPMDEDTLNKWIHFSRMNIARYGSGTGALVSRSTKNIIGWAGLSRPADMPPEIVYGLDEAYWQQGYGLEIAAALTKWCEKDLNLNEIRATVYSENTGSVMILEKLGFTYTEDLRNDDGSTCRLYTRPSSTKRRKKLFLIR